MSSLYRIFKFLIQANMIKLLISRSHLFSKREIKYNFGNLDNPLLPLIADQNENWKIKYFATCSKIKLQIKPFLKTSYLVFPRNMAQFIKGVLKE